MHSKFGQPIIPNRMSGKAFKQKGHEECRSRWTPTGCDLEEPQRIREQNHGVDHRVGGLHLLPPCATLQDLPQKWGLKLPPLYAMIFK